MIDVKSGSPFFCSMNVTIFVKSIVGNRTQEGESVTSLAMEIPNTGCRLMSSRRQENIIVSSECVRRLSGSSYRAVDPTLV